MRKNQELQPICIRNRKTNELLIGIIAGGFLIGIYIYAAITNGIKSCLAPFLVMVIYILSGKLFYPKWEAPEDKLVMRVDNTGIYMDGYDRPYKDVSGHTQSSVFVGWATIKEVKMAHCQKSVEILDVVRK